MKTRNYVVQFTKDGYGRKVGDYVASGQVWSGAFSASLQNAYVFNTRMRRNKAVHNLTPEELEIAGIRVVYVTLLEVA